eukprot:2829370-Pyramimonas_sp.AAC.1
MTRRGELGHGGGRGSSENGKHVTGHGSGHRPCIRGAAKDLDSDLAKNQAPCAPAPGHSLSPRGVGVDWTGHPPPLPPPPPPPPPSYPSRPPPHYPPPPHHHHHQHHHHPGTG